MGGGFCQWLGPEHGYWWCLLSLWPSGPASWVGSRAQGDLATARVDSELLGVCRPGQPWQSWRHWASTAVVHWFDCLHPSCQAMGPPLVCLHSILWFTARLLPSLFHVCLAAWRTPIGNPDWPAPSLNFLIISLQPFSSRCYFPSRCISLCIALWVSTFWVLWIYKLIRYSQFAFSSASMLIALGPERSLLTPSPTELSFLERQWAAVKGPPHMHTR